MDSRTVHKLRMIAKQNIPKRVRDSLIKEVPAFGPEMRDKLEAMKKHKDPRVREAAAKMEESGILELKTKVVDKKVEKEHSDRIDAAIQREIRAGNLPKPDMDDAMVKRNQAVYDKILRGEPL